MSSSILQFTLGIETGLFHRGLERAGDGVRDFAKESANHLKELAQKFIGVEAVVEGVRKGIETLNQTIEHAAALEQLHKQTGESVQSLYQLKAGFESVDVSGSSVEMMSFRIRKALSGVNEMGDATNNVFAQLGLSIQGLRGESLADQIKSIAGALSRSGHAEDFAQRIFGRGATEEILKVANSFRTFNGTMQDTAKDAKAFADVAQKSEEFEHNMLLIKSHLEGMFAGIVKGVLPVLLEAEDRLKGLDFTGIGEKIGKLFFMLTDAFKTGDLAGTLSLSIQAGFEQAMPYVVAFCTAFAATLLDVGIPAMLAILSTAGDSLADKLWTSTQIDVKKAAQALDLSWAADERKDAKDAAKNGRPDLAEYHAKQAMAYGNRALELEDEQDALRKGEGERAKKRARDAVTAANAGGPSAMEVFMQNFHPDTSGPTPFTEALKKKWDAVKPKWDAATKPDPEADPKPPQTPPSTSENKSYKSENKSYKFEGTAFEKMGAIMGGHAQEGVKFQERAAIATERMVPLLSKIENHLAGGQKSPSVKGWQAEQPSAKDVHQFGYIRAFQIVNNGHLPPSAVNYN